MTSDITQTTSLVVRNENNRVRHIIEASVNHISATDYGERSYAARTAERIQYEYCERNPVGAGLSQETFGSIDWCTAALPNGLFYDPVSEQYFDKTESCLIAKELENGTLPPSVSELPILASYYGISERWQKSHSFDDLLHSVISKRRASAVLGIIVANDDFNRRETSNIRLLHRVMADGDRMCVLNSLDRYCINYLLNLWQLGYEEDFLYHLPLVVMCTRYACAILDLSPMESLVVANVMLQGHWAQRQFVLAQVYPFVQVNQVSTVFKILYAFSDNKWIHEAAKVGVVVCEAYSYYTMLAKFKARVRIMMTDNISTIGVGKTIVLHFKTSRVHNAVYDAFSYVTRRLQKKVKSEGSEDLLQPNDNHQRHQKRIYAMSNHRWKWARDQEKKNRRIGGQGQSPRVKSKEKSVKRTQELYEECENVPQGLTDLLSGSMKVGLDDDTARLFEPISKIAQKFADSGLFPEEGERVDVFKDRLSKNTSDFITNIASNLTSKYKTEIISLGIVVIATYAYYQNKQEEAGNWKYVMGACIALLLCLQMPNVATFISRFFVENGAEVEAQADEQVEYLASAVLGYTSVLAGLKSYSSPSKEHWFLDMVKNFDRKKSDLTGFLQWFITSFQQCVDWICMQAGIPRIAFLRTRHAAYEDWITRCNALIGEFQSDSFKANIPNFERAGRLSMQGIEIQTELAKDPATRYMLESTRPRMNAIMRAIAECEKSGLFSEMIRVEPTGICIAGAPGIGKTRMLVPFTHAVAQMLLPDEDLPHFNENPGQYMYNRVAEHKYWDGYAGQYVMSFDDFAQSKDVAGMPDNEIMNWMRCMGGFQQILHCAGMDQKGKVQCSSRVLIANTNMQDFKNVKSIHEPSALERRFDVWLIMRPKEQYRVATNDGNWNYTLSPEQKKRDAVDWSIYEWYDKRADVVYDNIEQVLIAVKKQHEHKERKYTCTMQDVKMFDDIGLKLRNKAQALDSLSDIEAELSDDEEEECHTPGGGQIIRGSHIIDEGWISRLNESARKVVSFMKGEWRRFVEFFNTQGRRFLLAVWENFNMFDAAYVIVLGYALKQCYDYFFPVKKKDSTEEYDVVRDRGEIQLSELQELAKQQGLDETTVNVVQKVIRNNWFDIFSHGAVRMHGFFLRERKFIFPAHFLSWVEKYPEETYLLKSTFGYCNDTFRTDGHWILRNSIKDVSSDLASFDLNDFSFPQRPDITKFFCSDSTFKDARIKGFKGLVMHRLDQKLPVMEETLVELGGTVRYGDNFVYRSMNYQLAMRSGDCGLPIFIADSQTRCEKIAGFHVASRSDHSLGFGNVMTQELLKRVCDSGKVVAQGRVETSHSIRHVGTLPRKMPYSGKTQIVPSELFNVIRPSQKMPAMLQRQMVDGVMIDPIERALMRYDIPLINVDEDIAKAAMESVFSHLHNSSRFNTEKKRGILTRKEVICGIPGHQYYGGMDWQTSPGYPWVVQVPGYKGKEWYFGKEGVLNEETPQFKKLMEACDELRRNAEKGVRGKVYAQDMLKDELVSLEKAANGKTRLIMPVSLHYSIEFMCYFKAFQTWIMENRISNGISVGINEYSPEWEFLYRYLNELSNLGFDGDFHSFDAKQLAVILQLMVFFINQWYDDGPVRAAVRIVYWMEVWNSFHVCGKDLYEWLASLPSGHPATIIINCLYNLTIFRMAWIIRHDRRLSSVRTFDDNVRMNVTGDDNAVNLSKYGQENFNQQIVSKILAELGQDYTDSSKSKNFAPFKKMSTLTYLKRTFRYEPRLGRHVGPLDLNTILEMPQWTKKGMLKKEITIGKIEQALHELALHPPEVFKKWSEIIKYSSIECLGYCPQTINRNQLMDEVEEWGGSQKELGRYRYRHGLTVGFSLTGIEDEEGVIGAENLSDSVQL